MALKCAYFVANIKDISCDCQLNASGYDFIGFDPDPELHGFWVEKDGIKYFFNDQGNHYCNYVPDIPFKGVRNKEIL